MLIKSKFFWNRSLKPQQISVGTVLIFNRAGKPKKVNPNCTFSALSKDKISFVPWRNKQSLNCFVPQITNYAPCRAILLNTRQPMYVWRNIGARSFSHCCRGKAKRITYPESVFVIQHAMSVPVWLYHIFPHYLTNSTIFAEKYIKHSKCVLTFSTNLMTNISRSLKHSITSRYFKNTHKSSRKIFVFLVRLGNTCIFSTDFWKVSGHLISWMSM